MVSISRDGKDIIIMEKVEVQIGDIIEWPYSSYVGNRQKTKIGVYVGDVNHGIRFWRKKKSTEMAKVMFAGNKSVSIIPLAELRKF